MIPIVLAGGSGRRFWPRSRRDRPKQFLSLWDDDRTLIEATVDRLTAATDAQRVRIVCRPDLVAPTTDALADPSAVTFIEEPAARNTAPAIALATAAAEQRFGDEPVGFFPADHFVGNQQGFNRCLQFAADRAADGAIITIGVPPTRPETGYGYIETARPVADTADGPEAVVVEQFVEKPDRARAVQYLQSGRFLWNSGMFVFRPSTLWAEFERQHPAMWKCIDQIRTAIDSESIRSDAVQSAFRDLKSISIDYAIMEQARRVEVIPALFRWSDVGHWGALQEVSDTDDDDNVVDADALLHQVTGSTIVSDDPSRLIAACGLDEMVIVDTTDALLVLPRDRAQDVRQIVAELKRRGRTDLL